MKYPISSYKPANTCSQDISSGLAHQRMANSIHATVAAIILIATFILGLGAMQSVDAAPYIGGFIEGAHSYRIDENAALDIGGAGDRAFPRSEFRTQLTARDDMDKASFFARIDLVSDAADESRSKIDVREAFIKLYLANWVDVKFGRQVATWGTGDLVFANDLFAKDWDAFFTGMNDSYLKPPQDLLRLTFYRGGTTAELALSPHFTPDNLPLRSELSTFDPFLQQTVSGADGPMIEQPTHSLTNGEVFARVFGYARNFEWALYGYKGFWPTPQGLFRTETSAGLYHPKLYSTGASLRGPLGSYLFNIEGAMYISPDDEDGDNPMIPNSQLRGFVGLEKSLAGDWTISAQYYGEQMLDYDKYEAAHLAAFGGTDLPYDELRSTVTTRITKFMLNQTLQLSLFGYLGVSDEDWHLRPMVSYKITDAVTWTTGANLMDGDKPHTMFGQFRDNSNVYMRLRYSF